MTISITDEEWEKLSPENFETAALLRAVDVVDDLRNHLNDGEDCGAPRLRTDMLRLHQLAVAVINEGARSQFAELFDFVGELEDQVRGMTTLLEQVQETFSQLTMLYPERLFYADRDEGSRFGPTGLGLPPLHMGNT